MKREVAASPDIGSCGDAPESLDQLKHGINRSHRPATNSKYRQQFSAAMRASISRVIAVLLDVFQTSGRG